MEKRHGENAAGAARKAEGIADRNEEVEGGSRDLVVANADFHRCCWRELRPHRVKVLIAPRTTRQSQKSSTTPRSNRIGTWRATGGRWGMSKKYTTFPATTAIRDWTKFSIAGFDTGQPAFGLAFVYSRGSYYG